MRRLFSHANNQRGTVIVLVALALTLLLGITAFAIDIGMAYLARTELNNLASLVSLASIKSFTAASTSGGAPMAFADYVTHVTNAAQMVIDQQPKIKGVQADISLAAGDVQLGYYGYDPADAATYKKFTKDPQHDSLPPDPTHPINACRVHLQAAVDTIFAQLVGIASITIENNAAAAVGIRHMVLALDISGSMDDWSHIPTPPGYAGYPAPYNDVVNRAFHFECPATPTQCTALPANLKNFDVTVQMGGTPQPIDEVFRITKDDLLTNKLFNSFYRIAFITYGTAPQTRVPFPVTLNNKADIETQIDQARGYWNDLLDPLLHADYHIPFLQGAANPEIFPGGIDPNGTEGTRTGYTNIGGTILQAINLIQNAGTLTNTQSVDMIILLSDGAPTCRDPAAGIPVCNNAAAFRPAAVAYGIAAANTAKANNIKIHTIFFGAAADPGWAHMQNIASITGGKASLATDLAALKKAFEELNDQPSVVLAPLS